MDYKGIWGNLGGDGYVHYFNCDDSFMGEHICQNLGNWKKINMAVYYMSILSQ